MHAVVQWLTHDWENRKQYAISLLGKVRLCLVPVTDIIHTFSSHPFKDDLQCRDLYEDILKYHALGKKQFSSDVISECDLISTPRTAEKVNRHFQIKLFPIWAEGSRFLASPTLYVVMTQGDKYGKHLPYSAHWVTNKADDGISGLIRTFPIVI